MIIVKFMDKLYEAVPDAERNNALRSICADCCFEKDQHHMCNNESRMRTLDGSKVQGCVEGGHFYRKLS